MGDQLRVGTLCITIVTFEKQKSMSKNLTDFKLQFQIKSSWFKTTQAAYVKIPMHLAKTVHILSKQNVDKY